MDRKILIVDDEPDFHFYIKHLLEKNGYHVRLISDASTALSLEDLLSYDLILSDLHMPVLNGLHFIAALKKKGFLNRVFLFTLSSSQSLEELGVPEEYILNKFSTNDEKMISIINKIFA